MMAMVIASSIIDVTEVDSQKGFTKPEDPISNNDPDISKDISVCDNEKYIYNRESVKNIEGDLKNVCDTTFSNCVDSNHEKLQINKISGLADNSYRSNGSDFDKCKNIKLTTNDICINEDNDNNISDKKLSKRFLDLVDSDSEEESNNEHLNVAKHEETSRNKSLRKIDNEFEVILRECNADDFPETIQEIVDINDKNSHILVDSKFEERKEGTVHKLVKAFDDADISKNKDVEEKSFKRRKGSVRSSKNAAMRQIYSETQRLLRETRVSLPYHRPKQRTLQEFLNRKKITILPKAPSMAAKVKMSSAIVNQVVAEREKEAELFYKSSDSEDEMEQLTNKDSTSKDMKIFSTENEKIPSTTIEHTCIQNRRKTENDQNFCMEREITQQNQLQTNESRILQNDICKTNHQEKSLSPLIDNSSYQNNESDILSQETSVESNQDLQRCSVSIKLFDQNCKNATSKAFNINRNEQEPMEQIIETTASDEKCVTNEKKQELSKVHDDKIINEKFQGKNYMTNNVTLTTSDDYIIQEGNNERQDNCIEIDNVSQPSTLINKAPLENRIDTSAEEYQVPDGHVLGLPLPLFTNNAITDRNKLLPKFIPNRKITLKDLPGTIIDLTHDIKPNKEGINALLDRFFNKHVNTKKQADDESEITAIHLQDAQNNSVPIKEVFPYKLSTDIDNNPELNKPGAKLKRLKEDLKLQMTLKRNEQWKQKKIEQQAEEKEEWDEEEEEEEEESDSDQQEKAYNLDLSGSEESEPEENDICLRDKERRKCLFADDEAEVTEDEGSYTSAEDTDNESDTDEVECNNKQSIIIRHRKEHVNNASGIEIQEKKEEHEDLRADMQDESEFDSQDTDNINICKNRNVRNDEHSKTKKLMQNSQDVSDIDPYDGENKNNEIKKIMTGIDVSKKHSKDNGSLSEDECNTIVCQQNTEVYTKAQICKTPLAKTSMLDFISPITQLSVLNTTLDFSKRNSPEKYEYLFDKHESACMENCTQNDESFECINGIRNKISSRKRLFDDIGETIDDEYLMKLCSGKFESTQNTNLDSQDPASQLNLTESQLAENCPKDFDIKSTNIEQLKNPEANNGTCQNIGLTLAEHSSKSVNYADKENIISVADSKVTLTIASSDDEDQSDDADTFFKPKRHSVKKLILTDSSEEEEEEEKEGKEEVESCNEEEDDSDNDNAEQYIDYDSEENEMIIVPEREKDIKKAAAGFVEEEAELSGSDWDSADEDEKDLDKLEFEEGDDECIDDDKVKDELEKIHMKQLLDEDKREVRLLKELLFEDGDLHTDGTGRERKFKWRNIDKLEDNSEMLQTSNENDGWVDVQDDEEEAKWSKFRCEREKFLEERKKCSNSDNEDDLHDSKIFKFGLKALKKIENDKSKKQDISSDKADPSENMEPIMPRNITDLLDGPITGKKSQTIHNVMKKRSFLARGEESLARLASLAKQGDSVSHMVNKKNFVFQYIDPCINDVSKEERKTRKEDQELQDMPRKRKNTSDFSLTMKKRRK